MTIEHRILVIGKGPEVGKVVEMMKNGDKRYVILEPDPTYAPHRVGQRLEFGESYHMAIAIVPDSTNPDVKYSENLFARLEQVKKIDPGVKIVLLVEQTEYHGQLRKENPVLLSKSRVNTDPEELRKELNILLRQGGTGGIAGNQTGALGEGRNRSPNWRDLENRTIGSGRQHYRPPNRMLM